MKSDFLTNLFFRALQTVSIATMIVQLLLPVAIVAALYLLWRIARNLEKPPKLTEEVKIVRKSLSEMLKENRTRCKMTQEFVAEALGVSRQAVCDNLTRTEALLRRMEENIGCVRRDRAVRKAAQEILAAAEKLEASQEPETVSLARQIMAAAQTLKE